MVCRHLTICLAICIASSIGRAQSPYLPDASKVGLPMNGVFSGGSVDSVQVNNGNLHVDIPLLHLPGIGMDTDIHFIYDNQIFTTTSVPYQWDTSGKLSSSWSVITMSKYPASISDPLSGYLKVGKHDEQWDCGNPYITWQGHLTYLDYVSFSQPNGTARSFSTSGYAPVGGGPCTPTTYYYSPAYASDASGFKLSLDSNGNVTSLLDRHGTSYTFGGQVTGGNVAVYGVAPGFPANPVIAPTILTYYPLTKIEDSNGNIISRNSSGAIVDTFGHVITETQGPTFPNSVQVEAVGNEVSSISYKDYQGQTQTITIGYDSVAFDLSTICAESQNPGNCGPIVGTSAGTITASMPASIQLQNGDTYTIQYYQGRLGEIQSITLPTGGQISYTYSSPTRIGSGAVASSVATRTVTANGQSSTWTYTQAAGINTRTVTDPYQNDTMYQCGGGIATPCDYISGETIYEGAASLGHRLLSRSTAYTWTGVSQGSAGVPVCTYLPTSEIATWNESSQTTETDTSYDSETVPQYSCSDSGPLSTSATLGNVKSTLVYDYGSGGTHGALISNTQYAYLHEAQSTYLNANLLDRISQVSVYNSATTMNSSTLVAQTTTGYDSFHTGNQNGLAHAGWTTNHDDSGFGVTFTTRGLPTSVTRYTGASTADINTYVNYNVLGQPTVATDGRGKLTTNTYDTATPPNLSGTDFRVTTTLPSTTTNQTPITHSGASYQDPNTGLLVAKVGQNQQETTYTYDALMRPYVETRPSGGGSTTILHPDPKHVVTTTTEDANRASVATVTVDDLGRKSSVATTADSACGPLTVDMDYDLMGRVEWVSNPHCSTQQVTDGYTEYAYDALGRLTTKTSPDQTAQTWSFSGSVVDFRDETSRHWQHTYDAAERLVSVLEPDGSTNITASPTLRTDYTYDTLGNLVQVDQWGGAKGNSADHIRKFAYDAVSRLIASNNPESASPSNPASQTCSGAPSGTLWTTCYVYDPNGNVTTKTDNRGISITYNYDDLNRLLSKTYTDSTPSVTFQYDASSHAGASNDIGQLTSATITAGSSTLAQTTPYAYDLLGRLLNESQCTPATCGSGGYFLSYLYDWAGKPTSATFPSNGNQAGQPLTLTYSYDNAERLLTATSSWFSPSGDPKHPAVLFQAATSSNTPAYGPMGLQNAAIGFDPYGSTTTATLQRGYDDRGRIINGVYSAGGGAIGDSSSAGSIVISGSEKQTTTTQAASSLALANPASAGTFGSKPAKCWDYSTSPPTEHDATAYDTGSITLTVQSGTPFGVGATWGSSNEDPTVVLTSLTNQLKGAASPVNATLNGTTISLTSKVTGFSANYPVIVSVTQGAIDVEPIPQAGWQCEY